MSAEARTLKEIPAPRAFGLTGATRRIVFSALEQLEGGAIDLKLPDGTRERFGDGRGPEFAVTIANGDLFGRLTRRGRSGLGEGYIARDWDTDDLPGLLALLIRNARSAAKRQPVSTLALLQRARPRLVAPRTFTRARRDIHYHYDLGNELFQLFLDPSMTYSCAYFEREEQTLEEAQQAKYRRLCEKLSIGPEDRVLEIGCGWGGFALHAARERGAHVTGLTISNEQHAFATQRVRQAGLGERIEIRLCDYRALEGSFSKIASIEMFEAIGYRQFKTFFSRCDELLEPSGLAAIQTIAVPDQRFHTYRRRPDWIQQYIFPGSLLPSITAMSKAMAKASGLMVTDVEEIGYGYARTLRSWRAAFLDNLAEVKRLGYDDRFIRTWLYYLASCEALFETRSLRNVQLVMTRSYNDGLAHYPAARVTF